MGARDGGDAMTSCGCPTKTLETSPLDCVVPAMEDGEWRLGKVAKLDKWMEPLLPGTVRLGRCPHFRPSWNTEVEVPERAPPTTALVGQ